MHAWPKKEKLLDIDKARIKSHLILALLHPQQVSHPKLTISLQAYIKIICHDLSLLLNTRQPAQMFKPPEDSIMNSLYGYGVPDFSCYDPNSAKDREAARKVIQKAIEVHESRLRNVYVSSLICSQTQTQISHSLSYRIEAELVLFEPKLHIALDSTVIPNSDKVVIHSYPEIIYAP